MSSSFWVGIAIGVVISTLFVFLTGRRRSTPDGRYQASVNLITQSLGDAVVSLDASGHIREFNRAAENIFEYTHDEVQGQPVSILMREVDSGKHEAGFTRFVESGGKSSYAADSSVEVVALSKSGEEIPVSMKVSLVEGSEPLEVVSTLRDLRPEQKHRRVQEFLSATLESVDQAISIYDRDLELVAWNKKYENIGFDPKFIKYGAKLLELYKEHASRGLFGPGDSDELAQQHIDAIKQGPLIRSEIVTFDDNRKFRIERFRLPDGGICATFRDMADVLSLESQLRQSQKMEATGRLAGGVAHNFNNFLTVVIGMSELLLQENPTQSQKEGLQAILGAAKNGSDVAQRLLTFSRKTPLEPKVVELGPLLDAIGKLVRVSIDPEILLSVEIDSDLQHCFLDPAQLESSLLNLALNARDAMPDGGDLQITARNRDLGLQEADKLNVPAGCYVLITVTDTGSGMADDVLNRAFDPFFSTNSANDESGLGLALVYSFVRQSHGSISMQSTSKGTQVNIYLPAEAGESPDSTPAP
ncbi:MAG: PAS domain S-box protein [Pseudomonadota bacterium]